MSKQTICFFNSTKSWGGGEKWHFEMASYLFEKNYSVLVIVAPDSPLHQKLQEKQIPTETIKVSNSSFLNPFKIKTVKGFYKKHKVTTVVLNSSEDMKLGGFAAKNAGISRIIYRRGSAIPIKNKFINRYFFKKVLTEVLANSEATKATINANNPSLFTKEKITVIPNGIDTSSFLEQDYQTVYIKSEDEFVIGNLGRFVTQKNQGFLLDVTKELLSRNLKVKLVIGGSGVLDSALKEKAKDLGIYEHVVFTGFIKNPKDLMYSCDVFALSSLWEGFGYVIAEALLCEKPVIAFNVSSNPELVRNDFNGFLTEVNNVKAFSDQIQFFYDNREQITIMGEQGKNQIILRNDVTIINNRVETYLVNSTENK